MRAKVDKSIMDWGARKHSLTVTGGTTTPPEYRLEGLNGQKRRERLLSNTFVPAGATFDCTGLIPAGCSLTGITARVLTAITGATTMNVGDAALATRFGTAIALAAGTTIDLTNASAAAIPLLYTAAGVVRLTAVGGAANFSGGLIRVTAHFDSLDAETS